MGTIVSYVLVVVASFLATSVMVFFLEILAASVLSRWLRPNRPDCRSRPSAAVIVPAHNESSGLLPTLTMIEGQLRPGDRLLVVADNCTDQTAAVARAAHAEVTERNEPTRRGKGYALDWGMQHLVSDPRDVVVVVDADCRLENGAIDELVCVCAATGRPTQALYLMKAPPLSQINHQVAEFSWRVKNWLRPLGLSTANFPCQLTGTGMAFPWEVIRSADLANAHIVEDMKLGLDLTAAGHPPLFCPTARVTSEFASSIKGAGSQRQRWEQGHLDMIFKAVPRLLVNAVTRWNVDLFIITLDVAVPPLSLLCMLVLGIFGLSLLAVILGVSSSALIISTASLLGLLVATFLAWLTCGRDVVPIGALLLIPSYAFRKVSLYRRFIFKKTSSEWTRTDRTKQ
jgi:cellulose synthase/poly-beta-1,6-N-acetylglucosamine synthase-like glycosyltransferase